MTIRPITFDEIRPIWTESLWPGRVSSIEAVSALNINRNIDMSIMSATPTFVGFYDDEKLVGVNSGFKTEPGMYRSRGLYVMPEYRHRRISQDLLQAIQDQAIAENCRMLWSLPRQAAFAAYAAFGFQQTSAWFDMEFGPNCVAVKQLRNLGTIGTD